MSIHVYCYKVMHPGIPNGGAWFYDDYELAFQWCTGERIVSVDDPDAAVEESDATLTCFGWSR